MKEEHEAPSTAASAVGTTSPASTTGAASASVASRSSKVADSACSVGHSQSQRSGSSKSRISNSSGSSGYGGHPSTLSSGIAAFPKPHCDKDHRKKLKCEETAPDAPELATTDSIPEASASLAHKGDAASATPTAPPPAATSASCGPELAVEAEAAEESGQELGAAPGAGGGEGVAAPDIPTPACSQSMCSSNSTGAVEAEEATPEECEPSAGCARSQQLQQPASDNQDEFTVVVSMQDGAVIYTSPSITQVLSFPRDMWVGKSFIDYVHPDDRLALVEHITSGVALPRRKGSGGKSAGDAPPQAPLFCRLRRYPSLRDGFAVAERRLVHRPFSLQLSFYELPASAAAPTTSASGAAPAALPPGVLLTVTATAVFSAYTRPDEKPAGGCKFSTRHQADGTLTHVDGEAVPLLGHLPQQLLGKEVFDVYHPADLRALQCVYRQLVSKEGDVQTRGQQHRLRTHNGCYVRVQTEWSSFVNPWSKRLEFVVGNHCVLQGPSWPDVFVDAPDVEMFSEELLQDSKAVRQEILQLLQEEVKRREPGADRRDVSRRCKDLASFMESLIGKIGKPELSVDPAAAERVAARFSERSSVSLGEISPHHDYYDSKSSSETPPSYNQLNYDDNIQRFFESKPKTVPSDDSGERLMGLEPTGRSTDEDTKAVAATAECRATRSCLSPVNDTGSGSNSGCGSRSAGASANNGSVGTGDADCDYKSPQLTEALLCRHNEDMEKRMVQRHREQRGKGGDGKCKKVHHGHLAAERPQVESAAVSTVAQVAAHGTKRSGSHSWDGEPLKASKHSHAPSPPAAPPPPAPPRDEAPPPAAAPGPPPASSPATAKDAGLSLWPPFSVAVTPLHSPQPCPTRGNFCVGGCCGGRSHAQAAPQILPLYYLPAPTPAPDASASATAPAGSAGRHRQQTHAPPAFLQQQGGALPYVAAGVFYQAAPLLYPLAPPPPPPPSHLLALHQPLVHQHHQHQHPSTYQLAAGRGAPSTSAVSAPRESACQQSFSGLQRHYQLPLPLPRPASRATSVKVEPGSSAASVAASVFNRGASDGSQKCCRTSGEEETEAEDSGSGSGLRGSGHGQSSSSYTYSFLRSDGDADGAATGAEDMLWERMENGSSDGSSKRRPVLKDPPWLENVDVTPDLMFRYQVSERELDKVLKDDLEKLRAVSQPMLVNEQLGQLYLDMARAGAKELQLEEADPTSSSAGSGNDSAGAEVGANSHKIRRKRRSLEYSKLVMIFEENAPMPSPVPVSQPA